MIIKRLALDIELTNRCNALCTFCPRDKTPKQGFMTEAHFRQAVFRAKEENLTVMLTGQGESLIHPEFSRFINILKEENVPFGLTTNASLLKAERSAVLLEAGIKRITFSVSDLGDDYKKVYNLDVENTLANIDEFIRQNNLLEANKRAEVWVSIVEHGANAEQIDHMREFWKARGVTDIYQFKLINRGGACESNHLFLNDQSKREEALQLMAEKGVSTLCNLAFTVPFVGWNGNYYICCSDYEKVKPLASVDQLTLAELDTVKKVSIHQGNPACLQCNYDPLNTIQEALLQVEAGNKPARSVANALALLKNYQKDHPDLYGDIQWHKNLDSDLIARG